MQKGVHRIFIDVPLTHTSLQSDLSHKYSAVKISFCQEGVVEVKEVLKDAVEHLPDGHRWVVTIFDKDQNRKLFKLLNIFQRFSALSSILAYALVCGVEHRFQCFQGRPSWMECNVYVENFKDLRGWGGDFVHRNSRKASQEMFPIFPNRAPIKNFYVIIVMILRLREN